MEFKNNNKIEDYIDDVCKHIKNKRVHEDISVELISHIEEKVKEYIKNNQTEEQALQKVLNEMGSSQHVGNELNAIHKCNPEWSLLTISIGLVILSVVFIFLFKINGDFQQRFAGHDNYILNETILWGTLGVIALIIGSFINFKNIKNHSKFIYAFGLLLMAFTMFRIEYAEEKSQWLQLGGLSINSAYVVPIIFIISLIGIYSNYNWKNRKEILKGILLGILPMLYLVSIDSPIFIIMYDFSLIFIMYKLKVNKKIIWTVIFTMVLFRGGYEYIDSYNYIEKDNYICDTLKIIKESSQVIGRAINFQPNIIPEFYSDFMPGYIVYSCGWLPGIIVSLLIVILLYRIIKVGSSAKSNYGKNIVFTMSIILGIQYIGHILFNFGWLKYGLPLPFISYGGTSMVVNMFIIGIIINVYKGRNISIIN